jgi:hypothetical protein
LLGKFDSDIAKVFGKFKSRLSLTEDPIYDSAFFEQYSIPSVPHYIWIDEEGVIQALTGPNELNAASLDRFIAGQPVSSPDFEKKIKFDDARLLLVNGNGGTDTNFLFRSILSKWDPAQASYSPKKLAYSNKGHFFQALHLTVTDLYRYAYLGWFNWTTKDSVYGKFYPSPVLIGDESKIRDSSYYNYSFSTRVTDSGNYLLRRALRNDLATYFGYEAMVTERNMACWKLVALPNFEKTLKSKFNVQHFSTSYSKIDYQHVAISSVIDLLILSKPDDYPIINATGIDFPIDLSCNAVVYDRESMVNALRKVGLDLILSEQPMRVLLLLKK